VWTRLVALPLHACAACGGEFTADRGIVTSPNYPNPYHHNAVCIWTITVHPRAVVDFTITDIDIESHVNCVWDYIEVRSNPVVSAMSLALVLRA